MPDGYNHSEPPIATIQPQIDLISQMRVGTKHHLASAEFNQYMDKINITRKLTLASLTITQSELIGVDPYSPDLTDDQKIRIIHECKINPWYFLRVFIRSGPIIRNIE